MNAFPPVLKRLALGGAQWGAHAYGIANTQGVLREKDAEGIINYAVERGIRSFDTASSYDTSECVIGRALADCPAARIVTKTPVFHSKVVRSEHVEVLIKAFEDSLEHLKVSQVYGLLIHHSGDLLVPGGHLLFDAMKTLKDLKRVSKIGVSVYTAEQAHAVLAKFPVEIIQLPMNVLDQRFLSEEWLWALASRGELEIHARSIFLQGALLMSPQTIPNRIRFLADPIEKFRKTALEINLSPLQGALHFVLQQKALTQVIVGVHSCEELQQILSATQDCSLHSIDWTGCAIDDPDFIDPSRWKPV
ncbi:MAG: aldo/keto reductase [Elusimicrobia bacterium]|nr:aldo/keto reductase [Elusimicrobiota bacterium]